MRIRLVLMMGILFIPGISFAQIRWEHISSKTGAIETPNSGKQQTSCAVGDFNNDGISDFCVTERTTAPSVVWYQRTENG